MGASSSTSADIPRQPAESDYDEYLFSLWPGLEDQLVQSYLCHDIKEKNSIRYEVLEPVLRHHLMQCGLIEFVTRFCNAEGQLDTAAVAPYLNKYKLSLAKRLNLADWKNLCLAWLQLVQDVQAQDVQKWQNDIKNLQQQQSVEFKRSMELFQQHYLTSLEAYYTAIEADHAREQAQREEWEKSQQLQEDFYNDQMGFCQKANDDAIQAWNEAAASQKTASDEYRKRMAPQRKSPQLLTYSYQVPSDGLYGPISGGCRAPSFVPRSKKRLTA